MVHIQRRVQGKEKLLHSRLKQFSPAPLEWHFTNVNLFNSKWKKSSINLLKYHRADGFVERKNTGDKGRRAGISFIAEESYSVSLYEMEWEKAKSTIIRRMHIEDCRMYIQGWRIFMNREDSEMHDVQKILLVYLARIDMYLHIFCLC